MSGNPYASDRRRWIALVVVCMAMLMVALDTSIVNVALPQIQHDLHFSQSGLTWVVDAYLISFGSFLLLAGRFGDLVGRKPVFLAGVALFTVSSGVSAIAPDQATLIVARFVQGLGGAVAASVIIAIIVVEFPAAATRAKAMSAYMLVAVGGGSLGLLAGGVLTDAVNWHWIFVINLPIGVATLVFGAILIDDVPGAGLKQGVDIFGSLLMTAALLAGIYAIVSSSSAGWLSSRTVGFGAGAIALGCLFFVVESRVSRPIVPLSTFRIRSLMGSSAVRGFTFTGLYSVFFLGALYLEHVRGLSPLRTGFCFLPISLSVAALATGIVSRLMMRFGPMKLILPGLVAIIAGLVLVVGAGVHTNYFAVLLPSYLLIGLGMGTASIPLLSVGMADVPKADAGLASGIINVSMWVSSSLGLAILSTVSAERTRTLVAQGVGSKVAVVDGYHLAYLIAAGFAVIGLLVTVTVLRAPARAFNSGAAAHDLSPVEAAEESGYGDAEGVEALEGARAEGLAERSPLPAT